MIKFEANPPERVLRLVEQGEESLNVDLDIRDEIVDASSGSLFLAQMLSHHTCLSEGIVEAIERRRTLEVSFETVRSKVMVVLERDFDRIAVPRKLRKLA